ncbi:hypothetical protein QFZ23_004357 [Arthrobacter globiformis]|uniref:DUF3105 domain-containing protein n=1 Tax=Arthrobacter globiformis TaxID=1665 RepID=UPI00278959C7|nr:DUF3105 domain-containing protein [Arthrobacter globiformis]MDQ1060456.1 hypothetical protein [Arthrobacter globiformis]
MKPRTTPGSHPPAHAITNRPSPKSPARWRRPLTAIGVPLILATGALTYGFTANGIGQPNPAAGKDPTMIEGVISYAGLSRNHVQTVVTYPQRPGVGGDHSPIWTNCGVYDRPVQETRAVHSLEHGAVWISYQPELPADDIAQLARLATNHSHVLVSPFPGQGSRIEATAWGKQLSVADPADPRLSAFIDAFQQGPQTPEAGETCSGGVNG